jgi:hypothetical protein
LCGHGLPFSHAGSSGRCWRLPFRSVAAEPVTAWLRYAAVADAILRMRLALDREDPVSLADVSACADVLVVPGLSSSSAQWRLRRVARRARSRTKSSKPPQWSDHEALASVVNLFVSASGVRPVLRLSDRLRAQVGFASPTAFGADLSLLAAVAVLLLHRVAGTNAMAVCSGCGQFFLPSRRRAASRDAYCTACGVRAARRAATARYRARLADRT